MVEDEGVEDEGKDKDARNYLTWNRRMGLIESSIDDLRAQVTDLTEKLDTVNVFDFQTELLKQQSQTSTLNKLLVEHRWRIVHQAIYGRLVELGSLASRPPNVDIERQKLAIDAILQLREHWVWFVGAFEQTPTPVTIFNRWLRNVHRALTPHSTAFGEELVDVVGAELPPSSAEDGE